ncbi:MAG TPA: tetratricopeptide repeat protein, partial [Pirellulales bacterium]|nr:tetratricopeptide repeat protein [Pirellulales bacterium]
TTRAEPHSRPLLAPPGRVEMAFYQPSCLLAYKLLFWGEVRWNKVGSSERSLPKLMIAMASQNRDTPGHDSGPPHESRPAAAASRRAPTRQNGSAWKTPVIASVVALVCGVGGAWAYLALFGTRTEATPGPNDRSQQTGAERSAPAPDTQEPASVHDVEALKKRYERLTERIDLLSQRIDRLAKSLEQPSPVLHTLQTQITDLQRAVDQVANVPPRLRQLEQRLAALKVELMRLSGRAMGEEAPGEGPPQAANKPPQTGLYAEADPARDATLKLAIGLFREGHYEQAREVLRRLQRERPRDARVWYYAALANGMVSGTWDGATKRLVEQGIELERAGAPSRAAIDEALAGLTRALGKDWLAEQRRQAE